MPDDLEALALHVRPGSKVDLDHLDSGDTLGIDRREAEERLGNIGPELADLQELLYGAARQSVLIVLQGMDTSGKDGTIRRAFTWLNPQACRVFSFKAPTDEEAAHDFLWRVHQVCPAHGFLTIFNRSHYEDVLVPRVKKLVPREVWSARYEQINDFERMLERNGTIVLKFFLHIGRREQKKRLLDREHEADKSWKLSVSDWQDRQDWDKYRRAYEELIERCSTDEAPWHIVPANHRWFRDLAVASTVAVELRKRRPQWVSELEARGRRELEALKRYRAQHPSE